MDEVTSPLATTVQLLPEGLVTSSTTYEKVEITDVQNPYCMALDRLFSRLSGSSATEPADERAAISCRRFEQLDA